jgi:HPt (histidine-containing phosphotransfer) domain-containing protein
MIQELQENAFGVPKMTDWNQQESVYTAFLKQTVVDGMNFNKALERFSEGEMLLNSIRTYTACTSDLLAHLKVTYKDDLESYRITVHGVKGSSYAVGAEIIGDLAAKLEKAAKHGDSVYIEENTISFVSGALALLGRLRNFLEQADLLVNKQKKQAPDPDVLRRLCDAADSYDIDKMDKAMEELEKYDYENDGDLVPWIRDQIEVSEFELIKERLSGAYA